MEPFQREKLAKYAAANGQGREPELSNKPRSEAGFKLDALHKLISELEFRLRYYTTSNIDPFEEPAPSTKDVGASPSIFDEIDYANIRLARILRNTDL